MNPSHTLPLNLPELKRAYSRDENIMRLMREATGGEGNEQAAILIAYDLQAGAYVANLQNEEHRRKLNTQAAEVASILDKLAPTSLLEAGVGEATALTATAAHMRSGTCRKFAGLDLSWSRLNVARKHWAANHASELQLFVGEMEAAPLPDDAADVVITIQAVEPNRGREREIMRELFRIARRYLVLIEPIYELAGPEAQARMASHGYCRGLRQVADSEGWRVLDYRLLNFAGNPLNPPGVLLIEKAPTASGADRLAFTCPHCRTALVEFEGNHFCKNDGLVFPTVRGLPCLSRSNGIIASHYLE